MRKVSNKYQIPIRVGTLAFYGPNNKTASKIVAGITLNGEVIETRKWFQENGDIRANEKFSEEIAEYFKANDITEVAKVDKIIGCPHEEGIDYPEKGACNECPYWIKQNRWD